MIGDQFGAMILKLSGLRDGFKPGQPEYEALDIAIFALREYVEPWRCPDCGHTMKIPEFQHDPRKCPKCGGRSMFPYAYLEIERMNKQLRLMLQCLTHYARKRHGHLAKETLRRVNEVDIRGDWAPPDASTKKNGRSWFKVPRFWGK